MKAIEKAESLMRIARDQGAQLDTFNLVLSSTEAFELLDWFAQENSNDLLDEDIALAKRRNDPFEVLRHFTLLGFHIEPERALH